MKKLMAGGDYDENVLHLTTARRGNWSARNLLSALVGRNLQRRERARARIYETRLL
jgi:hypothetical protein